MLDKLIGLQRNKYIAFICRSLVHRCCPNYVFKYLLSLQNNPYKEGTYALTFDFDFEKDIEVFPQLLDLLKKYDIKAGLAVIGKFVEKYPEIHMRAVEEGHEIINHTYTHPDNPHWSPNRFFNQLSYNEQKYEIEKAHKVISNILGYDCVGFRTPHYGNLHTDNVYCILKELGYKYSSSTAACSFDGYGAASLYKEGIYEIPTACSMNFPLAIFDSWNMLRKNNPFLGDNESFIDEFNVTIECIVKNNKFCTHYFDPYDVIEDSKLERMLYKLSSINTVLYKDIVSKLESD